MTGCRRSGRLPVRDAAPAPHLGPDAIAISRCIARSWPRLLELAYWPTLQTVHLGLHRRASWRAAGSAAPRRSRSALLLGGVLLWEIALRSQMGVAVGFPGGNLVAQSRPRLRQPAAPVGTGGGADRDFHPAHRRGHRAGGSCSPGLLYAFNVLNARPGAGPVRREPDGRWAGGWRSAWSSLILRHGAGAEALAWSVLFGLTPFSAVFYPVAVLPAAVRPIALGAALGARVRGHAAAMVNTGVDRVGPACLGGRAEHRVAGRRRAAVHAASSAPPGTRGALLAIGE